MALKSVQYHRLETVESEADEDDAPPTHVALHSNSAHTKGNRWNHIDNLDEFFDRVYQYQQQHGLAAIALTDIMELLQFAFMVLFSVFLVTCLRFSILWADKVPLVDSNGTRDVIFSDLFDLKRLEHINPLVVMFLLMAITFWIHRFCRTMWRFYKFWEIRTFYTEALKIPPNQLRNFTWPDVVARLKEAQREYKMNIRKVELTELDVYHRILRFKNYMVAMVNKAVLPCKVHIPFLGEKVMFTHGLKYNYELLLFWGPGAPFVNSFYLRQEYKSAMRKQELVRKLQFRIAVLALINLVFCPAILLYQILLSFFSYAELLKRQPGVFGKRRWSLYGRFYLRHFNELDHELSLRLNKAYKPAVKYVDLFTHPIVVIISKNVAFFSASLLAVLLCLTVIQEDLLTAHNVLTFITLLGIVVTACRIFIPDEHQVMCPQQLMGSVLQEIHYMPDEWKEKPHTVETFKEFCQVFQFTMLYLLDELLSPLVTPFLLYFSLRGKVPEIVDFLRNFTIEVSGVGDVCSFSEMNIKKHGQPEWLSNRLTVAVPHDQAELGKTELSFVDFSRKNPLWKPSNDNSQYMEHLRHSIEELSQSNEDGASGGQYNPDESLVYLSLQGKEMSESMKGSIWSMPLASERPKRDLSTITTMEVHELHDLQKYGAGEGGGGGGQPPPAYHHDPTKALRMTDSTRAASGSAIGSGPAATGTTNWTATSDGARTHTLGRPSDLGEPLLLSDQQPNSDATAIDIHDPK